MTHMFSLKNCLLETRTMPAGQVTASFAAGVLTLLGTDDDSTIQLNQTGTTIEVVGLNGTQITGGPSFTGVTSLRASLGAGNNVLSIDPNAAFALTGAVYLDLGDGVNVVSFATNQKLELGSLTILAGDGPDVVNIFGGMGLGSKVAGHVMLNMGIGYNSQEPPYNENQISLTNLEIAGAGGLKYTALDGDDVLTLQTVKVAKALNAIGGEGMLKVIANQSQLGSVLLNSSGPATGFNTNGTVFESTSTTVAGAVNLRSASGIATMLTDATVGPLTITAGSTGFTTTNLAGNTTINGNVIVRGGRHTLSSEADANANVTGSINLTGRYQSSVNVIDSVLKAKAITLVGSGADIYITEFNSTTVAQLQSTGPVLMRGRTVDIYQQSGQFEINGSLAMLGGTSANISIGASFGDPTSPKATLKVDGPALIQARQVEFAQSESVATFSNGLSLFGAEKTSFDSAPWQLPGDPLWPDYPPYGDGAATIVEGRPFVMRGRDVDYDQIEGSAVFTAGWQLLGGEVADVEAYPKEYGTNPDGSDNYGTGASIVANQLLMTGEDVAYYQSEGSAVFNKGATLKGTASASFFTESGYVQEPAGTTLSIPTGSLIIQAPSAGYFQADGSASIDGDLCVKGSDSARVSAYWDTANIGARLTVEGNIIADGGRGEVNFYTAGEQLNVGKNVTVRGMGLSRTSFDSNAGSSISGNILVTGATIESDSFGVESNLSVQGNVTLNLGSGANSVYIGTDNGNTQINGHFTLTTGNGSDVIALAKLTVNGNTSILTTGGTDRLYFLGETVFSGTVLADLGGGNDTFQAGVALFDGFNTEIVPAGPVTLKKPVMIKLGSGNDSLMLGIAGDPNGQVLFLDTGALTIDGGTNLNLFDDELGQFDSSKVTLVAITDPTL